MVLLQQLDTDPAAPTFLGGHAGRTAAGERILCGGDRYVHFALSGLTRNAVECNEDNIIGGDVY